MVAGHGRDKPCIWTNGDGLWIRGAIRGLTFRPQRLRLAALLFWSSEKTRL
jgi:hypothetical protein